MDLGLGDVMRRILRRARGEHEPLESTSPVQSYVREATDSPTPQVHARSLLPDSQSKQKPTTARINWESLDKRITRRMARSGFFLIRCPSCGYEYMKSERGRAPCPECSYDVRARRYCWTCMRWIPALAIIHQNENQFCPLCFYNIIHQRRGRLILNLIKYPLIVILIGVPIWLLLIYLRWGYM